MMDHSFCRRHCCEQNLAGRPFGLDSGKGAEVIVTQLAPITRKVLSSLGDLKLVVVTRGGPVHVNVQVATERGVIRMGMARFING